MRIRAALLLSAVLLSVGVGAAPAAAAEPAAVGVVTTLQGSALVSRTALSQPLRLAFRDDVFPRDRISTGEGALVRVLLGGKAVVTVRELSVLTITERAGHAVVALDSGAVTASIAHDRLRPGEGFEIRTRNAVAAVRGTVLTVEAGEGPGRAVSGSVAPLSRILVHRGQVEVSVIGDPTSARAVIGTQQQVSVSGVTLGAVEPIPTQAVGHSASPAPQHTAPPDLFVDALAERESARALGLAHSLLGVSRGGRPHAGASDNKTAGGRDGDQDGAGARSLRGDNALTTLGRPDVEGGSGGHGSSGVPRVPLTAISRGQHGRGHH